MGLAGEVRPVQRGQERLKEAAKLGFVRAIVPKANMPKQGIQGIEVIAVDRVEDAVAKMRREALRGYDSGEGAWRTDAFPVVVAGHSFGRNVPDCSDCAAFPQPLEYHQFADARAYFGIPNFFKCVFKCCLSVCWNSRREVFLILRAGRSQVTEAFVEPRERWPYLVLFAECCGDQLWFRILSPGAG